MMEMFVSILIYIGVFIAGFIFGSLVTENQYLRKFIVKRDK